MSLPLSFADTCTVAIVRVVLEWDVLELEDFGIQGWLVILVGEDRVWLSGLLDIRKGRP
jgi:hypothetical protein